MDLQTSAGIPAASSVVGDNEKHTGGEIRWYVMRDLKRANAHYPAWKQLTEAGFRVFTPMKWIIGRDRKRSRIPVVRDLLFVQACRDSLDAEVRATPTLQYRYLRGGYLRPMTVPDSDMERFVRAVNSTESPDYYSPEEITRDMIGRKIRLVGGPLDGYEGNLLNLRGSRKKKIIVEVPALLVACVEINPDFIQFV